MRGLPAAQDPTISSTVAGTAVGREAATTKLD
jgi:hypothetical protein